MGYFKWLLFFSEACGWVVAVAEVTISLFIRLWIKWCFKGQMVPVCLQISLCIFFRQRKYEKKHVLQVNVCHSTVLTTNYTVALNHTSQNLSSTTNCSLWYKLVISSLLIGSQYVCLWYLSYVIENKFLQTRYQNVPQRNVLYQSSWATYIH